MSLLYNCSERCLVYCFHLEELELFGVLMVCGIANGFM